MSTITLKRLEIARALATEPAVLLVDEVAAGLDESELPRILEILGAIRQEGVTIILIEHVMKVMIGAVDMILVLNEGETIAFGKPDEGMNDRRVIECYLGESNNHWQVEKPGPTTRASSLSSTRRTKRSQPETMCSMETC